MNQERPSEGPYRMVGGMFEGPNGFSFRVVWGPDFRLDENIVCEEIIKIANQAHCEGRKAERERCARIADGLLDLEVGDVVGNSIATKIRGGQDGK